MSNSTAPKRRRRRRRRRSRSESEIEEENKDFLSDLPDGILLHVLSFLKPKHAVQTCLLSTRWKNLWKNLPTLTLHSSDFSTPYSFTKFVSTILTLRDAATALHRLDFDSSTSDLRIYPNLIERAVNYAVSRNVQRLEINVEFDILHLLPRIFTCQSLTSLNLSLHCERYLFPESLNLPALTTLHLRNFTFSSSTTSTSTSSNNLRSEPFSSFNKLNSLIIERCDMDDDDARILCISSATLVELTVVHLHNGKIELSTPCLGSFACTGFLYQYPCGSSLSSVQEVYIDVTSISAKTPLILLSWLRNLVNIRSLIVSSNTLQVLVLAPNILKMKPPLWSNLKKLKIKLEQIPHVLKSAVRWAKMERLKRADTESPREVAKLREEADMLWRTRLEPTAPLPDEIVDFLIQNSPSAQVQIIDCLR